MLWPVLLFTAVANAVACPLWLVLRPVFWTARYGQCCGHCCGQCCGICCDQCCGLLQILLRPAPFGDCCGLSFAFWPARFDQCWFLQLWFACCGQCCFMQLCLYYRLRAMANVANCVMACALLQILRFVKPLLPLAGCGQFFAASAATNALRLVLHPFLRRGGRRI